MSLRESSPLRPQVYLSDEHTTVAVWPNDPGAQVDLQYKPLIICERENMNSQTGDTWTSS